MAATQTEKQQIDVNSSEKLQTQTEQHLNLRNTLQNGTEKTNVRGGASGVAVSKTKTSVVKNSGLEMSQYHRQDGVSVPDQPMNSSAPGLDTDLNQPGDAYPPPVSAESAAVSGAAAAAAAAAAATADAGNTMHPGVGVAGGYTFPFGAGGTRANFNNPPPPDQQSQQQQQQNSTDNIGLLPGFGQFGPQNIRHSFTGVKQPMIGPRPSPAPGAPPGSHAAVFPPQQRFLSGQSISQPTGPTPTLNQLLQSSNRFQNNYGAPHAPDQNPYGQVWPSPKPVSSYSPQGLTPASVPVSGYRTQPTLTGYNTGPPPSSPSSYVAPNEQIQQQNQQPPNPGSSGPPNQQQQPPPGGPPPPRQNWNQGPGSQPSSNQHPPSSPGGPPLRQSPQPSAAHSPGPGLPPSPQQPPPPSSSSSQSQSFPSRPPQATTPNTHAPDTGDLTGQNSNDSSGGPAPSTPNSQGMRPTPSPTGSTGSRSLSPAVGQQNIVMPPRPSSSQSDGSGPTRMSHSPLGTQGGYQQHLGPPGHMPNYKMTSHPGMIPSTGQQMSLYNQQYPQAVSSGYPSRTQQYGPNQGYGPPAGGQTPNVGNSMSPSPGQYGARSVPNHVGHTQFPGYQQHNWGNQVGTSTSSTGMGIGSNHLNIGGVIGGGKGSATSTSSASGPVPQGLNTSGSRPPPHYLKQHLQHKINFANSPTGMPPSPGPPQGYGGPAPGMGPPSVHQQMGPPTSGHHNSGMGPPVSTPASMGPPPNMAPPAPGNTSAPPGMGILTSSAGPIPNSHDCPMPPPSSTPNSQHHSICGHSDTVSSVDILDNGITTTATGNMVTHVTSAAGGSVTSVVTTGPDGTTLDEGSQQSTLSNASAASGEDPQCTTPKSRKNEMSGTGHYSHPATPQSTVPSPGAASMNSMHEEYDISSPSWPRTPASPVFNSHVTPSDTYRSKKTDSLGKLYEMDDSPDRRGWLDKLLAFMEERRTPITTCPTISKNPLDLFRLYVYVKERGGFMEVCKVTKNKTWKDIAGMLGIGASSSAAYTLRKHYTKNLLAYECQFDRGGIDPQPIINQVEASSKKKSAKAASVPSPGSSNSQDSFPAAGSSGASMDGYGGYGYPPGSNQEYSNPTIQQRPSSQSNAPSPHAGAGGVTNHHGGATAGGPSGGQSSVADNINVSNPFDDVSPSPPPPPRPPTGTQYTPGPYGQSGPPRPQGMQQNYGGQTNYNQYPAPGPAPDQYQGYSSNSGYPPVTRPIFPPYGGPAEGGDRNYPQQQSASNTPTTSNIPGTSQAPPGGNNTTTQQPPDPYNRYTMSSGQVGNYASPRPAYCGPTPVPPTSQSPSGPYPAQQEYYRPDQMYLQQQGGTTPAIGTSSQIYPNGPPNKTMPPPAPQPRRHPDFAKDQQQYPPYGQQRPQLYGWPNSNQYRGQYNAPAAGPSSPQQWNQVTNRSTGPQHNNQSTNNQWDHRYQTGSAQGNYQPPPGGPVQQGQQWSPSLVTPGQNSPLRPPMGPRSTFRSDGKPFNMITPQGVKTNPSTSISNSTYAQQPLPKREISFPPDSVEATLPVLYRRKRICRQDLGNVDAWRVMMCLRSGLLSETTYALDVLNVLLFDDTTVPYFSLGQWPGLLELLLEHFRKSLSDMFDCPLVNEPNSFWYEPVSSSSSAEISSKKIDLGTVDKDTLNPNEKTYMLANTHNYTNVSRKNQPVRLVEKNEDIFIRDHHKDWDIDGDATERQIIAAIGAESWQLGNADNTPQKYILPCFQSEFNNISFSKLIPEKKKRDEDEAAHVMMKESENGEQKTSTSSSSESSASVINSQLNNDSSSDFLNVLNNKNYDKKKKQRTKTLSDVISRIKKETDDDNNTNTTTTTTTTTDNNQVNNVLLGKAKTDNNGMKLTSSATKTESSNTSSEDGGGVDRKSRENFGESTTATSICGDTTSITVEGLETKLKIKDEAGTLKRRRVSDYEDECYTRDEASLCLVTDSQDFMAKRCVCISNILRNLTFIPGNEIEFAKNTTFLSLLGKLLLLNHDHAVRTPKTRNYDREEDADFVDSCSSLQGESEWWWDYLVHIRENVLVSAANIAGQIDLSNYEEEIARPILDGLLHWVVCPSAHGQDPFPYVGSTSLLSPQRLALEALCKLCVTDANVDLVIATPPFSRLERLCAVLTKHLCRTEDQVLREFSVNLLHYLAAADSAMARVVAVQSPCVSLLVAFIEQAEQSALGVANQLGIGALRENPDSMGTSLDMLRRAAGTLLFLAKHPDNRPLFMQQEQRLLQLVMSQILDQQVAFVISRVLFHISRTTNDHKTGFTSVNS